MSAADKDAVRAAAVALGRRGGLKGGPARAAALSPERRSEIAQAAADARWGSRFGWLVIPHNAPAGFRPIHRRHERDAIDAGRSLESLGIGIAYEVRKATEDEESSQARRARLAMEAKKATP